MPRVFQQVDWSNGGDGIVARDGVENVDQLRGKTVVLAQNSPSQYFLLNALINGGVQPAEVNFKFTADAFQAAAAFNSDKSIAAAVSWAPDIYNLAKAKGNKLIVTTADRQQAHRRRLVRARRLRQGQPGHHRGPGARHLRRHGGAQDARRTSRRSPS